MRSVLRLLCGVVFMFGAFSLALNLAHAVPSHIESAYDNICWNCYEKEVSMHNFLNKHSATLRNLCNKKDAKACVMMAKLNGNLNNSLAAQEYWQKACKLGDKEACPMVEEDEDDVEEED